MSRRETDEFNFVGLARSPVKQTPHVGYYDRGASHQAMAGEPLSAVSMEEMATACTGIREGSTSFHCRRALQLVPSNVLDTRAANNTDPSTPSTVSASLAQLSSSLSSIPSRKAELAKRSRLPVSRTLKLSPTSCGGGMESGAMGVTATSTLTNSYSCDTEHESPSQGRRRQESHILISPEKAFSNASRGPYDMSSRAAQTSSSFVSKPATKTRHKIYSPAAMRPPFSPGHGVTKLPSEEHYRPTPKAEVPCKSPSLATLGPCTHGSDDGNWSDSSFGQAMFSPASSTANVFNASSIRRSDDERWGGGVAKDVPALRPASLMGKACHTPFSPSNSQRGGSKPLGTSVSDFSPVGSTAASDYAENTVVTEIGNINPRSILQRSACDGVANVKQAVEGAYAAMMTGGTAPAAMFCVDGNTTEDEEGDSDEARDLFPDEPSQISMRMDRQARSTPAVLELLTLSAAENTKRSVMTPKRPIAASALLELSDGTPRGMIRGIIGGAGKLRQPEDQHRSFPQVTDVPKNIEEETPRRFIKGVLACNGSDEVAATALQETTTTPASVAAAKAAAAAAAAAVPEISSTADGKNLQQKAPENIDIVEPKPDVAVSVLETAVPESESSATASRDFKIGGGRVASAGGIGRAIFNTALLINAIVLLCLVLFLLAALVYMYLTEPLDNPPIY